MSRIPPIFLPAIVRVVTPSDGEFIGLGFDTAGATAYVRLSVADARQLAGLILSHSDGCSGMPKVDVSSNSPVR
jgi:hypothetical protein